MSNLPNIIDNRTLQASGMGRQSNSPVTAGQPSNIVAQQNAQSGVTTSPLTDVFPITETITGGFTQIDVQAGLAGPAGLAAWYPLIEWKASTSAGQGVNLYAIDYALTSTNNADANPVTLGKAWGDSKIGGACIVVGMNLPVESIANPGWRIGASGIPGIDTPANRYDKTDVRWMAIQHFPGGSYNDAIPLRLEKTRSFAPYVFRVMQEQTIQVALVLRGDDAIAAAGDTINGFAQVALSVGIVENTLGLPSL